MVPPTETRRVWLKTLGCKANLHDSEGVLADFLQEGWTRAPSEKEADLIVVNTCTVTDEAEKESRRQVRVSARRNPEAKIYVTGCAVEVNPDAFRAEVSTGGTILVGMRDRAKLASVVHQRAELGEVQGYGELASRHPMDREWPAVDAGYGTLAERATADRTRVFLKIQEGCNTFCTYCIIPYGRGPSRSLDIADAVARARDLVETGAREIVLTGTNIGEHEDLDRLVAALLEKTTIERLRISSLDPSQITPFLFRLAEEEARFCPHFHVSLQSPLTRILKLMKRGYTTSEVVACLERLGSIRPIG
ncbi:MAG: radical SAM protein, partial [Bdellovibrionota bacterium]